jgi:hypothetical protein
MTEGQISMNNGKPAPEVAACLRASGQGQITPITRADRDLYQQFFAHDQHGTCYGNSLIYLTQACRGFGLGLKYTDHDMLLSIGYHRGHAVLVRPLGVIDQRVMDLLAHLRAISGMPVFLKKLFPDQVQQVRQFGMFTEAGSATYPWDTDAFADDDTYPEVILDVAQTIAIATSPSGSRRRTSGSAGARSSLEQRSWNTYRRWRATIRRFQQTGQVCQLIPYQRGLAAAVRTFLQHYFAAQPQNVAAYEHMLTLDDSSTDTNQAWSSVAYLEGIAAPVGLLIAERLDADSAGYYAHVVSRRYPGLSEYLLLAILERLQHAGIRWLNLGGSETMSQHQFKRKFVTAEIRAMPMLVYDTAETSANA